MASHFQCVGIPLSPDTSSEEEVLATAGRICAAAEPLAAPAGYRTFRWLDGSDAGAWVVVAVDEAAGTAALQCFTPVFQGTTRRRVRVQRALPDAECPFCDFLQVLVLPGGGIPPYALLMEVKEEGYDRTADLRGEEFEVAVALMAGRVRVFADGAAFAAAAIEDRAPECFLATGLEDRPPRPRVDLVGIVESSRTLRNSLGDGEYVHAVVRAGGGNWDLLVAAADVPEGLRPGNHVLATATAVGWRGSS